MPSPLTTEELREQLGEPADTWPAQGLTAVKEAERVEIFEDDVLIGWVEQAEYPHLRKLLPTYSAVITAFESGDPWGVAFPGGYMPPDPAKARFFEQLRWLPAGHPDRPNEALNA